jgi:DNA polymerase-3 subunit alpha
VIESLVKAGAFDSLGHTPTAIDACMETKRAEAIGQFDLFGELLGAGCVE